MRAEITAISLQNLPVPIGRNYENLLVTIPGVAPPDNQHSISANPSRGLTFSVNGSTRNSNAIRIDGSLATNLWLPHVSAYSPTLEAIQSVSVVTGAADADQGLAGGSAVNVQVKSGTNQMHGSAFEYHTDNAIKAKPFFLPTNQRKPKFINNQFGGSLGGPIKKDKLFYFTSYEATRDRQTGATIVTVPTAAILRGDMSASPNEIYDPLTGATNGTGRTVFANKLVPTNRIDPLGLDPSDPNGKDDIATINQLQIPVNTPVIVDLSSKDVIHSFSLPVMRVKQDAIPGQAVSLWFEATQAGEFEIACAQLCGLGHYRMRGFFTVAEQDKFDGWMNEQILQKGPA